ncbi:SurA N-terminal domain-containing protein [Candidatus Pelagibacter sp. FZCC0015]|uniref:SurA N-terminal domain-containing protein n=1 Tax=Candidatus Pelagibacter sp. FZCC0015 TaxID=2268451 RepID=UPI0011AA7660|nr:SurA N-terminal domain-containing protein [Candidatus Pelagibacter sp. FZCC0015]
MIEKLKNLGWKQLGGLVLIVIIIIAFGFGGFGGGFSTNNQNNIAKINKTNVTTQDFIDYVNQSGISQEAIRDNLDNNIIEELLSGLISTTLIDLEIKDFDLSINERTILKNIKENKNFQDENGAFQRIKYEKFLLSNNLSAPMFELQLKNRELQKHLFDFIGAGTITPNFLIEKKFEENNKSLDIEYFDMENLYKTKNDYTANEIEVFIDENKDQLKREYIDFKYVILNPKNLIGIEEFNQEFFDEIDSIENKISQGSAFDTILEDINVDTIEVNEFAPSSSKQINEDLIYSKKASKIDLIESGDNFLLYNIDNQYDRAPDLNDEIIKGEIVELIYQKGKFDYNREIIEEIQKKEFDNSKFEELAGSNKEYSSINSIEDDKLIDINSVKMLYALPVNSFALVNKEDKIFLVKITGTNKNSFNKADEKYLKFVNSQNTNNRKTILQSYDQLLNDKYQVQLNQKTIDRVKNYFK